MTIFVYTVNRFEWDDEKAQLNVLKHGIGFLTAASAFDDPGACIIEDLKHSAAEVRRWLIGYSDLGMLVVVFTMRRPAHTVRIISARRAKRKERAIYEKIKRV